MSGVECTEKFLWSIKVDVLHAFHFEYKGNFDISIYYHFSKIKKPPNLKIFTKSVYVVLLEVAIACLPFRADGGNDEIKV